MKNSGTEHQVQVCSCQHQRISPFSIRNQQQSNAKFTGTKLYLRAKFPAHMFQFRQSLVRMPPPTLWEWHTLNNLVLTRNLYQKLALALALFGEGFWGVRTKDHGTKDHRTKDHTDKRPPRWFFSGEISSHLTMYSFTPERVKKWQKMTLFVGVVYSKFVWNLQTSRKFRPIYLHMRWLLFIIVHYVCEGSSVYIGVYSHNYDKKHNRHDILFPEAT